MTGINDRAWESMIDRIDLDVTDAELAAAEQQLQQLAPEEEVPVRAEWLAATVANVRTAAEERDAAAAVPAPVHKLTLVRRLQRFAAAAAAVVGIHSFATAATVATVGVVAVTAVVIWKAGVFSYKTMTFPMAVEIQLNGQQADEDRSAALQEVYRRIKAVVVAAQSLRDAARSSPALVLRARSGLQELELQLNGEPVALATSIDDSFQSSLELIDDLRTTDDVRIQELGKLFELSKVGIGAILRMPNRSARMDNERSDALRRLVDAVKR